ncbi:hypothetical protein HQ590_06155 [bacterium]|nr:hypothetical protein [bacterium]
MKTSGKTTFALFFGNRGFFPASLQQAARRELKATLKELGHKVLVMDEQATRYGAVETPQDGELYAEFLRQHRGEVGGVILSLPNFGDENGAVAALKDANVPILIQAYPDELDKMAPAFRRDSFCGKFSIMDVFYQNQIKFTALKPHVVHPSSPRFRQNIDYFDRLCRVVQGIRNLTVGAIGARTTAFKTVRIDELALQRHGITMETTDLTDLFARMQQLDPKDRRVKAKAKVLKNYTRWDGVPAEAFDQLVRLGVALDQLTDELQLDAMALRCWVEMQKLLKVSPCVLASEMNNRGVTVACEVDVGNAVMMHALQLASGKPPACLDWNNNYGEEDDKCILFHCGPVPADLMTGPGQITDHSILANACGTGCGWGCNTGRIAPTDFTYGSLMTESGKVKLYVGQGRITKDSIPKDFFGVAGVAEIPNLQDVLLRVGMTGHRHHVSITPGHVQAPLEEALEKYLGLEVEAF